MAGGALIVFVAGVAGGIADGNSGDPLVLGLANSSGSSSTTLSSSADGNAFAISQTGSGRNANALRADAVDGTAAVFLSENNNAIFAKVTDPDRYALVAENDANSGSGASILARGNRNPGLVVVVEDNEVDPLTVNSTSLVDNFNADMLDGLHAADLLPGGPVPEGTVVTGAWAMASEVGGQGWDTISFGFELSAAPLVEYVDSAASGSEHCPGSADDPQAQQGYLCVYEGTASNLASPPCIGDPVTGGCGVGSRFGFIVAAESTREVAWYVAGTWAVSQPAAGDSAGDDAEGDGTSIFDALD